MNQKKISYLGRGVIALSALFVLMGAKGDGCTGTDEDEAGSSSGTGGGEESSGSGAGYPGMECGPGEELEIICEEPCEDHGGSSSSGVGGSPAHPLTGDAVGGAESVDGGVGYGEECYAVCVPVGCPEGFAEAWMCGDDGGYGSGAGGASYGGSGSGGAPACEDAEGCEPPEPGEPSEGTSGGGGYEGDEPYGEGVGGGPAEGDDCVRVCIPLEPCDDPNDGLCGAGGWSGGEASDAPDEPGEEPCEACGD